MGGFAHHVMLFLSHGSCLCHMQISNEMVSNAHVPQLTVSLSRKCFVKNLSCLNPLHSNGNVFEQPGEFCISFFSGLWWFSYDKSLYIFVLYMKLCLTSEKYS